jgi:hypothetical protein
LDYVLVLQQQSVFCSFFHQDEEFVTPLINWQFAACNSVLSWSTWRKLRGDGHKKKYLPGLLQSSFIRWLWFCLSLCPVTIPDTRMLLLAPPPGAASFDQLHY